MGTIREAGLRLISVLLQEAQRRGADILVTACPLCQFNLECFQERVGREFGEPVELTVGFFTQILGLALGAGRAAARNPADAALAAARACIRGRWRRACLRLMRNGAAGEPQIGVYVCHCGLNIAGKVDVERVVEFAATLPNVAVARNYTFMCSDPGQDLIQQDIRAGSVNRVVVASCSPLMHEATFRRATEAGGISPFQVQMASIREHVSWVTEDAGDATEKAKALVAGAVSRVASHEALERRQVPVHPDVLVVGAGISGIHAALTLANAGKHVYLVEREPSVGGHMAMFDKTFPTLDCAACILTPKMVQLAQHPNIELLAYSEVEQVSGHVGSFKVRVRRKASYIDETVCNGCGLCIEQCTFKGVPSEFDQGLGTRPVVYTPFPQAVPRVPVIDRAGTSPCTFACPAGLKAHGYVSLIRAGEYEKAFNLMLEETPLVGTARSRLLRAVRGSVQPRRPGGPAADPQAQAIRRRHPLPHPRLRRPRPRPRTASRWR